jgi:hypothetical protein
MNGRIYRGNTIYLTPGEIEAWAKKKNYTFEDVAKQLGMTRTRLVAYLSHFVPRKWYDIKTWEILEDQLPPGERGSYWAPPANKRLQGSRADIPISTCSLPHGPKRRAGQKRTIRVCIRPDVLHDWLTRTGCNKTQAAAALGVDRAVLYRWLKEGVKQKRFAQHVMKIIRESK